MDNTGKIKKQIMKKLFFILLIALTTISFTNCGTTKHLGSYNSQEYYVDSIEVVSDSIDFVNDSIDESNSAIEYPVEHKPKSIKVIERNMFVIYHNGIRFNVLGYYF